MQPTVPSWAWLSWGSRARTRGRVYGRAPRPRDPDKYAFYGLRKDGRHFIRLDPLSKSILVSRQWAAAAASPTSAPVTWRVEHYHDTDTWRVPDIKVYHDHSIQSYRPFEPVSIVMPGSAVSSGMVGGGGVGGVVGGAGGAAEADSAQAQGWHAARGWVAGAVLLALLVLIVRAAENCLHKKLFKAIYMHTNVGAGEMQREAMRGQYIYHQNGVRRLDSEEWSRPNVTATSLQHHSIEIGSLPRLDNSNALSEVSQVNNDLPPPYSECARSTSANLNKYISEEPPPPYSACYVTYKNPKDGIPTVHIHNRRRQNILDEQAHSSVEIDNVQNDLIENGQGTHHLETISSPNNFEDIDPGMRTELVFDNGRIVERVTIDLNSNETDVASNVSVEETRHDEIKEGVAYIDGNVPTNTTPARVLLV